MTLPPHDILSDEVIVHRDVMVAMRDGVRLATDIYRPAHGGRPIKAPAPALLERTPYGKLQPSRSEVEPGMSEPMRREQVASHFVRHGYALVYQDCRGRYGSEGVFTKYLSEGPDGFDTMDWIATQSWCDGRIGTMGLSYAAHTQLAAACLAPPGLTAMILDSGGFSNAYTCGIRQGGAFELKQATWAYGQAIEAAKAAGEERVLAALEAEPLHDWFNAMPWSEGRSPLRASPDYEAYLLEQWRHEAFDAHWKQIGIYAAGFYDAIPPVPVALMSSWFDAYVPTTLENYAGFAQGAGRPLTLIMGAGLHGDRNATFAGDVDFGAQASFSGHVAPSWLEFRRLWFDRWMKQGQEPASAAPVNIFLMGGGSGRKTARGRLDHGGRWISGQHWPLPGVRPQSYFLHPAGRLSTRLPESAAAPISYSFDPDRPVPTIGGALTSGKPVFEGGGFDQREDERFFGCVAPGLPLAARRDVLSFESEPLAEDMAVVGPVTVTLFAATDGLDTDFTAKLIDVYPPNNDYPAGFAMNLTDGIIRCRLRHGDGIPCLAVPGATMELTIRLFATANLFKAGHRIRLDISSSNFPKFDVNPNTGEPAGVGRARRVACNTVLLDAAHPSRLEIALMDSAGG